MSDTPSVITWIARSRCMKCWLFCLCFPSVKESSTACPEGSPVLCKACTVRSLQRVDSPRFFYPVFSTLFFFGLADRSLSASFVVKLHVA